MLRHPLTCLAAIPLSLLFSLGILVASLEADPVPPLIIHAAGRVDGISGTNSLEALEETYAAGGRAIEIDFDWTSDGELVCIHDFTDRFTPLLHGEPCTLEEFLNIRYLNRYTPMTARDLLDWLSRHTDVILITDFKSGNVDGLETLAWMAQDYPNLQSRIYPQIYHQEEYWPVRGLGYRNIIYTLYAEHYDIRRDAAGITAFAQNHPLAAVTVPMAIVDQQGQSYVDTINEADIPLYIHTVNGIQDIRKYQAMGIYGVYTDYPR